MSENSKLPKQWSAKIFGSGVVTTAVDNKQIAIPHGDYILGKIDGESYQLIGSDGKSYALAVDDIPQYLSNATLKIDGDFP